MAGAGYKLFNTGDVLTAAQVNTYLMQQTVMVFASSAARTTALSGVLAEGMVSYLQDTNTLEVYDGSAWVGATGDITGLTAGTGITITNATGPVPTVTNDVVTTIDAKGDLIVGTGDNTYVRQAVGSNNQVLMADSVQADGVKWANEATATLTAKGDILTATAANTLARLAVGNSGETIVADSSTSTGLRYNPPVGSLANPIINGGFDIWQRGTSGFVPGNNSTTFAADRWLIQRGTTGSTVSRQTISDSTNLPNIQYALRVARDSGNTSTSTIGLATNVETTNSIPFANRTVTLSFYARAGANYSATSSALNAELRTGTGTDENTFSTYTGSATPISSNVTLTTTWQRFALTGTLAATTTEFALKFVFTPVGTAGANDWYEISGVQVDVGTWSASTAPAFRRSGNTLAGELAASQRYYFRQTATAAFSNLTGFGYEQGATSAQYSFFPPVTMRVKPSSVDFSAIKVSDYNSSFAITAFALNGNNADGSYFLVDATIASGGTAGRPCVIQANNNSAAYIGFSAEL